jgi:hypothetical protein
MSNGKNILDFARTEARFGLNVQRFTISRAAGEEIRRIEKSEGHAAATQRLLQILRNSDRNWWESNRQVH